MLSLKQESEKTHFEKYLKYFVFNIAYSKKKKKNQQNLMQK